MLKLAHFYHLWADGEWEQPATEHWAALEAAGWEAPVYVGLVGSDVRSAAAWLKGRSSIVRTWARTGYEHVTLRALHRYAQRHDGAIMYAHTKGAHNTAEVEHDWRRYMTDHLVGEWRDCAAALEDGYDAAGPCWIQESTAFGFSSPIFGGNFWMARNDYLRKLPPLTDEARHAAEIWLGHDNPRVHSTAPFVPPFKTKVANPHRRTRRLSDGDSVRPEL